MALSPRWNRGLAALSGVLLYFSFPNAWALHFEAWPGWVAWVALVPLLASLQGQSRAEGFRLGFMAGLGCFLPGLLWLTKVEPLGLGSYPAWAALSLWCSLFLGLFGALVAAGLEQDRPLAVLWIPCAWTVLDWARERALTGFPWLSLGSSQYTNAWLRPLAAVLGSAGLGTAVCLGNVILFGALVRPAILLGKGRSLAALAFALALAAGARWQAGEQAAWTLQWQDPRPDQRESGPRSFSASVALIQGGLNLDQPWTQAFRQEVLRIYFDISRVAIHSGAKILVWPESAFPGFFNEDAPEAKKVKAFVRQSHVDLILGSTLDEGGRYTNDALWVDPQGNTLAYVKRHLVLFGEWIPFQHLIPGLDAALDRRNVAFFEPGTRAVQFNPGGARVLPLVCFESVFPDLCWEGPQPDLMTVLTVDSWYGRTSGPVWHASQASLRAVENGCWVVQAATTGISLFALPDGSLSTFIDMDQSGLVQKIVGPGRPTPYRRWGDAWVLLCLAFLAGAFVRLGGLKKG